MLNTNKNICRQISGKIFDCGIAEQDMTATAAGLASEGKIPFIASFAVFATGRNYDQIRMVFVILISM